MMSRLSYRTNRRRLDGSGRTPFALRVACPALAVLGLLAGCSSDRDVLARVGSYSITREDFLEAARTEQHRYSGPPDSARAALLEDLVRRELMVQAALSQGLHRDTLFLDYRRRVEEQLLRERILKSLAGGTIAVSDAEVEAFYRARSEESRCRLIFTIGREVVTAALDDLRRGVDFAAVADRFNLPGTVPPGGDLGFLQPGLLVAALDLPLRTAPLGEIVGPIESPDQGWFIMRVEERRPRQQPPLETQRAELVEMIRQRKQALALTRGRGRVRNAYGVRVMPGAAMDMVRRLTPLSSAEPPTLPHLSVMDRGILLAEFRGGAYTLGDAADDLLTSSSGPNFAMIPMVERWIESQTLNRALLYEAFRRLYNEDAEIRRQVRERLNRYLLEGFYNREIRQRVEVVEADLRVAYQRHADAFIRLEEVRLLTATLPDSSAAAQLMANAGQTGTLREVVTTAALPVRVKSETIHYPNDQPLWQELEPRLMSAVPGHYVGPQRVAQGWMVFQLISKVQRPQRYEELPQTILQFLQGEAFEVKQRQRLASLSDSLRRSIPTQVHADRLRFIPWPVPGGSGMPGA